MLVFQRNLTAKGSPQQCNQHEEHEGKESALRDHHQDATSVSRENGIPDICGRANGPVIERPAQSDRRSPGRVAEASEGSAQLKVVGHFEQRVRPGFARPGHHALTDLGCRRRKDDDAACSG